MQGSGRKTGWSLLVFGSSFAASPRGSVLWLRERSRRAELVQAREAFSANFFNIAHQRLTQLAERWPDDGEVLLLLGECDLARGHREEALKSWSRVLPKSPFYARAANLQATHLINSGRYSKAEDVLIEAVRAAPEKNDTNSSGRFPECTASRGALMMSGTSFVDHGAAVPILRQCSGNSGFSTTHRCPSSHGGWRSRKLIRKMIVSGWVEQDAPSLPAALTKLPAGSASARSAGPTIRPSGR